ncbi:MAG: IPT/TIG domain-containing protein, partial [Myxococcota bacterium]
MLANRTPITLGSSWRIGLILLLASLFVVSGCSEEVNGPDPSLQDPAAGEPLPVDPGIICKMQHPDEGTEVTVTGEKLSPVSVDIPNEPTTALPSVTLVRNATLAGESAGEQSVLYGSEPDDPNAAELKWYSRDRMGFFAKNSLTLGDGSTGMLYEGMYDVRIKNPESGESTSAGSLAVTDRPHVVDSSTGIVCVADQDKTITLEGQTVLRIGEDTAVVNIAGSTFEVDSLDGCTAIAHEGIDAEFCDSVTVTLNEGSLEPGYEDITLLNPETAACESLPAEDNVKLRIAPPPSITDIEPNLICLAEGSQEVSITGTDFLTIDGGNPTVTVGGVDTTVTGVSGCSELETQGSDVQTCTEITAEIPQDTSIDSIQNPEVVVTNPPEADCSGTSSDILTVVPPPTITSTEPASLCQGEDGQVDLTVNGYGFLEVDGEQFTVSVEGTEVTPSNVTDCDEVTIQGQNIKHCRQFTVGVDVDTSTVGGVDISITNPGNFTCSLSTSSAFEVAAPPTIAGVAPSDVCQGEVTEITVTGENLTENTTVTVGGETANVTSAEADGSQLTAEVPDTLPAGSYDVTVSAGSTCSDTATQAIEVRPTPLVFFTDPPVIYNDTAIKVTVFTADLDQNADTVELIDSGGAVTDLPNFTSVRPNRIQADVPAGLNADTYDVRVTSAYGCVGELDDGLQVTDTTDITLQSVDPAFVSPTEATAVTINADPSSSTLFAKTPRVYLNPDSPGPNDFATALTAVVQEDTETLSAVVPGGLNPGQYDLIVVNPLPGAEVGVLDKGVTVTSAEPPLIDSVTPGSLDSDSPQDAVVEGSNFGASGGAVEIQCELSTGAQVTEPATINNQTDTQLDITVPTPDFDVGSVCIVRFIRDDGAQYEYSAISIRNPAQNLASWSQVSDMQTPRRGLGLAAGRPTAQSRFLYAIGGDDGTVANAMDSIESVSVGVFGALGGWMDQRYSLPEARTDASFARIGRFIYLIGGDNGSGAQNTVWRAEVLDPLAGPDVADLDARLGDGTAGLGGGFWYYRVSAVFPSSDNNNPDGESLPGDVLPVKLPDRSEKIILTLDWDQVPGASGYRVYRTSDPDGDPEDVELIAEINSGSTTEYDDEGEAVTAGEVPLPQGSLGQWKPLTTLNTARAGAAATAVQSPADPSTYYLYAFGGGDGAGTVYNTYEWAEVTIDANGDQTVSAWTESSTT